MENQNKEPQMVSNEQFYMDPHSISTLLFEKELKKNKIEFIKNDISILQPYIAFSFFTNDINLVSEIFDKIQKTEFEKTELIRKMKNKKKKAEKRTFEYRQKRLTVWILVLISIIVILSLLLS